MAANVLAGLRRGLWRVWACRTGLSMPQASWLCGCFPAPGGGWVLARCHSARLSSDIYWLGSRHRDVKSVVAWGESTSLEAAPLRWAGQPTQPTPYALPGNTRSCSVSFFVGATLLMLRGDPGSVPWAHFWQCSGDCVVLAWEWNLGLVKPVLSLLNSFPNLLLFL